MRLRVMTRHARVLYCVLLAAAAACSSSGAPSTHGPPTTANHALGTAGHPPPVAVPIGSGDRHPQRFCAVKPATGTARYLVRGDVASVVVRVRHLTAHGRLGIVWGPGGGHAGEVIGMVEPGRGHINVLAHMFHAPYYDRPGRLIVLKRGDRVIARLRPC